MPDLISKLENLFDNAEIRLASVACLGVLTGASSVLINYYDRGFSRGDVSAAYQRGQTDALRISPPSERLEITCAALWFYTNSTGIKK
jgi:hypothetical protein